MNNIELWIYVVIAMDVVAIVLAIFAICYVRLRLGPRRTIKDIQRTLGLVFDDKEQS